ncbi:DNA alkylation repair protein [Anaerosacchariphilus polymeriproducens]|uniref:DNA alkylation repair protein n=1 Tax=Anaerosacchariphilus polymeriproducens TaxID=1812858 RepID=A0A371ATI6_9FIRM|nr:DNA alkylation repair protein [Anaerosacchariphilus polymeriproducens]RDU22884.1 DNA alkylation repair protein [Anaerosacchariphilus polymeriproducens]
MEKSIYEQLILHAEPEYKEFSKRLLPGVDNIIGVRLPVLRKIAKKIAKNNPEEYLKNASDHTFEEIMIQGMVIGYLDRDIEEVLKHISVFLPKINNWSVCDSFCTGLKITEKYPQHMWVFLQKLYRDESEYIVRFAVVILLRFFITEEYILNSFSLFDRVKHQGYYVKMAVAWAVSTSFVKFPDLTKLYLQNNNLDDFTYNKSLQKILESLSVSKETKEWIRKMKR